ncbi:MAG: cellulase family glycosylhydrolase [Coriobacteriales bacterium]|nr:cellulase family glycosylhydrolase [Coriobacteriales bacterium]
MGTTRPSYTAQAVARAALFMCVVLIACAAFVGVPRKAFAADAVPMYRLYNPNSGEHFYTSSAGERDNIQSAGWRFEGVGWYAVSSSAAPVYRLYNPNGGDHHYTLSMGERDLLAKQGWRNEGIGWYSDETQTVPVYRQYNPNARTGAHNFTTSKAEGDALVEHGWHDEGISWYGMKGPAQPEASGLASPASCGALQVSGSRLVSQAGTPVQLRGISTHGLAWFPDYVNSDCFYQLRNEWHANVVRLAMYTQEYGGYCSGGNQAQLKALVKSGVTYAAENDLYVIVDWHILSDGNPLTHVEEAKAFFGELSAELAGRNNVLYEICNEPNGGTTWADIKSYANQVIPVIRANDADAVVLVGTPFWSQEIDAAAADPLDFPNVMYTLHFYAATHRDDLRNRMSAAVRAGLPVFVSEFGICDASGNGSIDEASANAWLSSMREHGVSWCMWSLCNKAESASAISSSCTKTSGFVQDDLTQSGRWLVGALAQ